MIGGLQSFWLSTKSHRESSSISGQKGGFRNVGARAAGGEVKLCQLSAPLLRVLQITNLLSVLPNYPSEREAIDAFSNAPRSHHAAQAPSGTSIVCIDSSSELLAYLKALLTGSGFEAYTTKNLRDAMTIVNATRPRVVICGPGMQALPTGEAAVKKFSQIGPNVQVLLLPSDFSTAEAGQAGVDVVDRVRAVLG